jgi:hypothetical protein
MDIAFRIALWRIWIDRGGVLDPIRDEILSAFYEGGGAGVVLCDVSRCLICWVRVRRDVAYGRNEVLVAIEGVPDGYVAEGVDEAVVV